MAADAGEAVGEVEAGGKDVKGDLKTRHVEGYVCIDWRKALKSVNLMKREVRSGKVGSWQGSEICPEVVSSGHERARCQRSGRRVDRCVATQPL